MGRFIRQGLLFALVCILVHLVAFWVLCHVPFGGTTAVMRSNDYYSVKGGTSWYRFAEHDPSRHYDIRVLGSSHAYRGYDPRIFQKHGIGLYNLGSSAQTPMNSYHLMREYVTEENTGLLILDLYDATFGQEGLESTSDLTRQVPSDRAAWGMGWGLKDMRALNLLALRCFTRADAPAPLEQANMIAGYCPRTDSLGALPENVEGGPAQMDEGQWCYLQRILELAQERRLPIVLVSHFQPSSSDHRAHEAFAQRVRQELAMFPGVRYIDLTEGHGVSDRDHFYDRNHLNQAGVDLFNAQLIDSLQVLGLVTSP